MADQSLPQMFHDRARGAPSGPAYRWAKSVGGPWVDMTFSEAQARVDRIAAGLLTGAPLTPGASIGVLASTRVEWLLCDWAAMSVGYKVVAIYPSLLVEETGYIHQDAKIELTIVENAAQLAKVRALRGGFTFQGKAYDAVPLRKIVVMDAEGIPAADDWESLADVEKRGGDQLAATAQRRKELLDGIRRDDVSGYVYTSGTTGAPKGVVLTHGNWLSVLEATVEVDMFTPQVKAAGALLFLPMAHSFGRFVAWGGAYFQTPIIFSSIDTLAADLVATQPGFVPAAPRMYEKMYQRILGAVAGANHRRQKLFRWALSVGKARIPYWRQGRAAPLSLRVQHAVADRLVFSKLRARLGLERCASMLSGSAPLAREVHEFFLALGVLLVEAYGLTETAPGLTANSPRAWKIGTVGKLLKGVTLRIAADGEILAKGPNITRGYHNRDDANAEAFDAEGWFHTGDIGELDDEGFLRITDRKKDLLKTSGGKYIAPQKIEGMLKTKPLITEAVVIGDNLKYCTALLVVDDDGLKEWAARTGNAADRKGAALLALMQQNVDAVNASLSSFESIKYFRIVDEPFTVDNGLLTASFKVKRKAVVQRHAALIESMYPSAGAAAA